MLFVYSHILYLLALAVSNRDGADEAGVLMLNLQRCLFASGTRHLLSWLATLENVQA